MSRITKAKVLLVPLDNRPVTYLLPQLIAQAAGVEALVPPRQLLSSLKTQADLKEITKWLHLSLQQSKLEALFVCLDTVLYGGMVPWSRVSHDPLETVRQRVKDITEWKSLCASTPKIYAQASIMRIPDYDDASEEPTYWQQYGRKIFKWSALEHKKRLGILESEAELKASKEAIPDAVRNDFLSRRDRNFKINSTLLEYAKSGVIDHLVFSQDDTGEFGLNVFEKTQLIDRAKKDSITNIVAYAGADEVMPSLIARWLANSQTKPPMIDLCFSPVGGENVLSNYEGQTIGQSLHNQISAAGLTVAEKSKTKPDFTVIVHTSGTVQGDHIWLPGHHDLRKVDTSAGVKRTLQLLENTDGPCVLCDVAYSNGADPALIDQLLKQKSLLKKLWAYSGWNTTGNTVGAALALGTACWFAKQNNQLPENEASLKRALYVRFVDDWAYQTQVREQLKQKADEIKMKELMGPYLKQISQALDYDCPVELSLPWRRTFEIEVDLPVLTKC